MLIFHRPDCCWTIAAGIVILFWGSICVSSISVSLTPVSHTSDRYKSIQAYL